jgi:hypothetical protein
MRPGRKGTDERGFALLLVFAMAAAIAVLMYLEIPRVVFEHQRDKEALLADRGEQFIRAIQLYAKKFNKYPQTLDDLDRSQNIRFLRRRYKDPMTDSDEWRLIHVDAGGQYTDSKVHKKAGALDKVDNGPSILASTVQGIGASATIIDQSGEANSPGLQRRASDRISPGAGPGAGAGSAEGSAQPAEGAAVPSEPGQGGSQAQEVPAGAPGTPPATTGVFNNPFLPPAAIAQALSQQAQQQANQTGSGSAGQPAPGSSVLGNAPLFGIPTPIGQQSAAASGGDSSATGAAAGQTAAGSGSMGQSSGLGAPPAPPAPPAALAIQQILGSQRGGATAPGTGASGGGAGPSALGAGLVGVASKKEQPSIRHYKDQTNYSYWEFVYDPRETTQKGAGAAAAGAAAGTPGSSSGSSNSTSSFGGMSGGTPAPAGPPND